MKTIIDNNEVKLAKGTGYWDLSRYPWGGSFRRLSEDCSAPLVRVVDTYEGGSPRRVIALLASREIGIQL